MTRGILAHQRVRRGLAATGMIFLIAAVAPVLTRHDPTTHLDPIELQNAAPSVAHPFGTDLFSRDVLSRVLYGGRVSLVVASLAVLLSMTLGTAVGLLAGFAGGVIDTVLMRLVDAALAIPRIFLVLMVLAFWQGLGLVALIAILGFTSWFGTSRLVRAEVLSVRNRDYVWAARALGISPLRVALRHALPNVAGPILVTATLSIGQIILLEAGLSFLGIGVAPPTPSLGNMIAEGREFLLEAPWVATFPGVTVLLTVLAFSVLSEGLREALDPQPS